MAEPLSLTLAKAVLERQTDEVPSVVLAEAVDRVADTVGVALGGLATPAGAAAQRTVLGAAERTGASRGAVVWGAGRCAPVEMAALANGIAAHALDYDDSDMEAIMHTGAIVVPTALAVGEEVGASGNDVLAAIVAGYEVAHLLGRLSRGRLHPRGFQPTAVLGIFAAAAVVGRLRRFSVDTLVNSFGICSGMGSGLMEFVRTGGDTKPIQVGWASHAAIVASSLAAAGASGPAGGLDGEFGVFQTHGELRPDLDGFAGGDFWRDPVVTRIETKFYPVCHAIHGFADSWKAVRKDLAESGLEPLREVREVHCAVTPVAAQVVLEPLEGKYRPSTAHQARFSLPYCLGEIALHGSLDMKSFRRDHLDDEQAHEFARKVTFEVLEPTGERRGQPTLRVVLSDGRTMSMDVHPSQRPRGTRESAKVREKLHDVAADFGPVEALNALYDAVEDLYESNTTTPLLDALYQLTPARAQHVTR